MGGESILIYVVCLFFRFCFGGGDGVVVVKLNGVSVLLITETNAPAVL